MKGIAEAWQWYTNGKGIKVRVRWWTGSPIGRASVCDRCHRRVLADEPRCQIDDGGGPDRKSGHGKNHTWLCEECAANIPHMPEQTELPLNVSPLFDA